MESKQFIFDSMTFLKKKDLVVGKLYLFKDNSFSIYLGESVNGTLCFYKLCNVMYDYIGHKEVTLAHYDTQYKYLVAMTESLMHSKCDSRCVCEYKGIPQIYCSFPYLNYIDNIDGWYVKSSLLCKGKLPKIKEKDGVSRSPFVSVKDLVPGELYYTGSLWRSLYLYLGRDKDKYFCWYFVANNSLLRANDFNEYSCKCIRTKSNKKCKRLADALDDPNAYMFDTAYQLIQDNWKADLRGFEL